MLVVTDNGVKIQLTAPENSPAIALSPTLKAIGWSILAILILGIGSIVGLWSGGVVAGGLVLVIVGNLLWHFLQKKQKPLALTYQPKEISGGEILVTPYQIEHISMTGQKSVYPLPHQIEFCPSENQLLITDNSAQPLLTIAGFNNPQHASIAQAVLQGKSLKTQGKAIKMQGS